jgi:hypothetical protein
LAAEEGRDLQGIDDGTDLLALAGQVDVCNRFKAIFFFDGFEDRESAFDSGAAVAIDGSAVGFIEGAFKENVQFGVFVLKLSEGVSDRAAGFE